MHCDGCAELEGVSKEVPRGELGVRVVLLPAAEHDEDDDE